jgi:hypothetical protein
MGMMEMIVMGGSLMTVMELGRRFSVLGNRYSMLMQEVGYLKERIAYLERDLTACRTEVEIWRDKYMRSGQE